MNNLPSDREKGSETLTVSHGETVRVERSAILEPTLLYRASKCKQTKEQGSEDCLWTHIFTFL